MKEIKSVTVIAKKWRCTYGTSYFSARVYVDGVERFSLNMTSGYGKQYETNALGGLKMLEIIRTDQRHDLYSALKEKNVNLLTFECWENKKSVEEWGKSEKEFKEWELPS